MELDKHHVYQQILAWAVLNLRVLLSLFGFYQIKLPEHLFLLLQPWSWPPYCKKYLTSEDTFTLIHLAVIIIVLVIVQRYVNLYSLFVLICSFHESLVLRNATICNMVIVQRRNAGFTLATITTPNTSALTNCHVYCAIHKLILPKTRKCDISCQTLVMSRTRCKPCTYPALKLLYPITDCTL